MIVNAITVLVLLHLLERGMPPYACGLVYGLVSGLTGALSGMSGWDIFGHAAVGLLIGCGYFYLLSVLRERSVLRATVAIAGGLFLVMT